MEQSVWDMTHFRIRELAHFGDDKSADPIGVLVSNPENKDWGLAIDSMDGIIPVHPKPSPTGTVSIHGREYNTVVIDDKEWMAENLDIQCSGISYRNSLENPLSVDGQTPQSAYYDYDAETYGVSGNKYGLLYNWAAANYINMHLAELGIPEGWHVPSQQEFQQLYTSIGAHAVLKLKVKPPVWDGTDAYGFGAVPGGRWWRWNDNFFSGVGSNCFFWTCNEVSSDLGVYECIPSYDGTPEESDQMKSDCHAIRLVRDAQPPAPPEPDPKYIGKRIGVDRLIVLGPQNKVPAANMPSCISECSYVMIVSALPNIGNVDYVYCVRTGNKPDRFYRWVLDEAENEINDQDTPKLGSFVPIACNYTYKDGKGTEVVDNGTELKIPGESRQIDLVLAEPDSPVAKVLKCTVANGISHTKSGIGDDGAEFPTSQMATVTDFGDTFFEPNITLNATGHTSALTETEITFSSTEAQVSTAGLVKIAAPETDPDAPAISHIQPISASSPSPGTVAPAAGEYVYVAPADHVHSAAKLTFSNLQNSSGAYDIEYNMASDVTLDMMDVLHALPPSNAPSTNMMLQAGNSNVTSWTSSPTVNRHYISTGHSFVVVGTNTSLITNGQFKVLENTLYHVNASIQVKITEGLGLNSPANVPKCYVCVIDVGGVTRSFNIPGSYTFTLPYTVNVDLLYKSGSSSASDHMVNVDVKATLDDNIFSACCELAEASELI